jgi:hypothetical protein
VLLGLERFPDPLGGLEVPGGVRAGRHPGRAFADHELGPVVERAAVGAAVVFEPAADVAQFFDGAVVAVKAAVALA